MADVLSVDQDFSTLVVQEPGNESQQRGFSAAGGPDNCGDLALSCSEAGSVYNFPAVLIGKFNIPELNIKVLQCNVLALLCLCISQLIDALYSCIQVEKLREGLLHGTDCIHKTHRGEKKTDDVDQLHCILV